MDFQDSRVTPAFVEALLSLVAGPKKFGLVGWKFGGDLVISKIIVNLSASIGI